MTRELYAGYVPLTKKVTVILSGCPSGVTPVYPALGVCPGGILQYSVDYRNIVAGAGAAGSTEIAAAMLPTGAGTFGITDDGTLSGVSQTLTPNWSTFTLGLRSALAAGVANTLCGNGVNPCGDTTAGTTFVYDGGHPTGLNATKFTATVGGAAFQLYPQGFPATTGQGSITFAVTVK